MTKKYDYVDPQALAEDVAEYLHARCSARESRYTDVRTQAYATMDYYAKSLAEKGVDVTKLCG